MPLSEHEERILAEIERQLAEDDPRFASRSRRGPRALTAWSRTARLRVATVLGVIGFVCVLTLAWSVVVAGIGMALVFGAIGLAATTAREPLPPAQAPTRSPDDVL